MTCRPQLKFTGIFKPRVKLQNNKQKVRLSNSGSGGVNPKERSVKAKGLEKLEMWPWCRHPHFSLLPDRGSLTQVSISGHCRCGNHGSGGREHANRRITGWGNSDSTSGVNNREEKQKVEREPEPQPGEGSGVNSGRREENIRSS